MTKRRFFLHLADWLDARGWTDREAGERFGVSREAVRLWRLGERMPNDVKVRRIETVTRRAVTRDDLVKACEAKGTSGHGKMDELRPRKRRINRAA